MVERTRFEREGEGGHFVKCRMNRGVWGGGSRANSRVAIKTRDWTRFSLRGEPHNVVIFKERGVTRPEEKREMESSADGITITSLSIRGRVKGRNET